MVASAAATLAAAEVVDTERPAVVVVGAPRGHAVADRFGPWRRGQASSELPRAPRELWRHELPGGLDFPPLVDGAGNVVVVLANRNVVKLGPDRDELWRARLGAAAAVLPPVLTSDGSVAVVCADGRVRRVTASGQVRAGEPLSVQTRKAQAAPMALDDGSVIVASERQLVRVGHDGRVIARAALDDRAVGGLLRWGDTVVVTTESGAVLSWKPPAQPRRLGDLGGNPSGGGVLVGRRSLAAVVDRNAVITFDLHTGHTKLLTGSVETTRQFEGPVVVDRQGRLHVATVVGELLTIDHHGAVLRRVALENAMLIFGADGGAPLPSLFRRVELEPSPPLVVDRAGWIGFVRASGRTGVVAPAGAKSNVHVVSQRFCAKPLGVAPAGKGRMLVACRNGSLGMFADGES